MVFSDKNRFQGVKFNQPIDVNQELAKGFQLCLKGNYSEARAICFTVIKHDPRIPQPHFLLGLIEQNTLRWNEASDAFGYVLAMDKKHAAAWAHLAFIFAKTYQYDKCNRAISEAIKLKSKDPNVLNLIGKAYQQLGEEHNATTFLEEAVKIAPKNIEFKSDQAFNHVFLGDKADASRLFREIINILPAHASSQFSLSSLNKAKDDKHITEMKQLRKDVQHNPRQSSLLNYAIGKEYEDLEKWEEAFDAIELAAKLKRGTISFNEQTEQVELFEALKEVYTPSWLSQQPTGSENNAPIFVLGQPRTGTTLVERIISAHSSVQSAGELGIFPVAVKQLSKNKSDKKISAAVVRATQNIDPKTLGERYLNSIPPLRAGRSRLIDKLTNNFLYIPLIATALPNAKIIHLRRNPMDSCFANFKQHFIGHFPHTYDQEEIARHYARYHDLMATWRNLLPGRIFDVDYEKLVSDMEPNTRKLIDFLELDWEDGCLDFHNKSGPVKTASASQVREKAHTKSVKRWKKYQDKLQPMYSVLREYGLVD